MLDDNESLADSEAHDTLPTVSMESFLNQFSQPDASHLSGKRKQRPPVIPTASRAIAKHKSTDPQTVKATGRVKEFSNLLPLAISLGNLMCTCCQKILALKKSTICTPSRARRRGPTTRLHRTATTGCVAKCRCTAPAAFSTLSSCRATPWRPSRRSWTSWWALPHVQRHVALLRQELPAYREATERAHLVPPDLKEGAAAAVWDFWRRRALKLPHWFRCACEVALVATSSASVERLFALYRQLYSDQQDSALEDRRATGVTTSPERTTVAPCKKHLRSGRGHAMGICSAQHLFFQLRTVYAQFKSIQ